MQAAKNKYDTMVEKGIWNAPTAEEKIIALKAKLATTVKSLSKKLTAELGKSIKKKKGGKQASKEAKKKNGNATSEDLHPAMWPAPKVGDKKEKQY
jgi:hypothetical protein